ncbi:MAG: NAD(P)H-dependent oxidoreductase subunit E [Bacteroidales bacterium]|jgi:NADH-quinone oxidoreductase E subunit
MSLEFVDILKKYPAGRRENLIPILQEIQDHHGFIPESAVSAIAEYLEIPAVKIYSVATFYNEFRFDAGGKYHFQICQGIGCELDGSERIRTDLSRILEIGPGEITGDGWFSLEWVPCLGVCQEAPVLAVNGIMHPKMTPTKLKEMVDKFRNH